jgi:hypothetical protein
MPLLATEFILAFLCEAAKLRLVRFSRIFQWRVVKMVSFELLGPGALVSSFHHWINVAGVKELVKKVIGVAAGVFGVLETYNLFCSWRNGTLWSSRQTTIENLVGLSARVAIIAAACTIPPLSSAVGAVSTAIFGSSRLVRWFGPNVNFVTNPWHPRHVVSIASWALALPALVHAVYSRMQTQKRPSENTPSRIRLAFHLVTHRVTLHGVNALLRRALLR